MYNKTCLKIVNRNASFYGVDPGFWKGGGAGARILERVCGELAGGALPPPTRPYLSVKRERRTPPPPGSAPDLQCVATL